MTRTMIVFTVFLSFASTFAFAQADVNVEQGTKPYGSYMGGDIDSVSLTNGNLNLHIPLVSYPQRGGRLKLEFFLRYNNKGCHPSGAAWVCDDVGVDVAREQVIEGRVTTATFSVPVSGQNTNEPVKVTTTSVVAPMEGRIRPAPSRRRRAQLPAFLTVPHWGALASPMSLMVRKLSRYHRIAPQGQHGIP